MRYTLAICIAIALIATSVSIITARLHQDEPKAAPPTTTNNSPKSNRPTKSSHSPSTAAKILRKLPNLDLAQAPSFDEIESLCASLSDADLHALIEETGFADPEGLLGWLRCALWAELARRDHILAFDILQRTRHAGSQGDSSIDAMDQITASYFRGRITGLPMNRADLDALFEEIYILQQTKPGITGILSGFGLIFGELAKRDPATAWQLVHHKDPDNLIPKKLYDALKLKDQEFGYHEVFKNLQSADDIRNFVNDWTPTWNSPQNKASFKQYIDQQRSRFSGLVMVPEAELLAATAGASLARIDPEAALDWLHEAGPLRPDGENNYYREHLFHNHLADHHPETARQWLSDPELEDHHHEIATRLIRNNPSSAPEIIALVQNPLDQCKTINDAIHSLSNNRRKDYIPQPGRGNRLPDPQGRFDAITEAINISQIAPDQQESLHKSLAKEFARVLPHLQ